MVTWKPRGPKGRCSHGDVEARRSESMKGRYQSLLMESQHGHRQGCRSESIEVTVGSGGGSKGLEADSCLWASM
jgi:hypothetical protein